MSETAEMTDSFFERPIINSPYEYPSRHWELDESGQPTNRILGHRRRVSFITPIPKSKKHKQAQPALPLDEGAGGLGTEDQQYELIQTINSVRRASDPSPLPFIVKGVGGAMKAFSG